MQPQKHSAERKSKSSPNENESPGCETVIFLGGPVDGLHVQRQSLPETIDIPTMGARGKLAFYRYRRTAPVVPGEAVIYAGEGPCAGKKSEGRKAS